jgi:hypothetical protein
VFPYVYLYFNFAYASDHALTPDLTRLAALRRPDGTPVLGPTVPPQSVAADLLSASMWPAQDFIRQSGADAQIITDDNLLSEYRHGERFGPALLQALQPPTLTPFAH